MAVSSAVVLTGERMIRWSEVETISRLPSDQFAELQAKVLSEMHVDKKRSTGVASIENIRASWKEDQYHTTKFSSMVLFWRKDAPRIVTFPYAFFE